MSLLDANPVYKPFRYPWAYDAWLMQQRMHWLPEEVPLADDVKDWQKNLTEGERNLLTQIFRFFTQADVEVNNCYMKHYSQRVQADRSADDAVRLQQHGDGACRRLQPPARHHRHARDRVSAFLKYKEMKDKYDYMQHLLGRFQDRYRQDAGRAFGAFTEGLQLFASASRS
jgi:ribonucleoside-diphosphate reductase beta chain